MGKKLGREEAGKGKSQEPEGTMGYGVGVRMGSLWWMYRLDKEVRSGWTKRRGMNLPSKREERLYLIRSCIVEKNLSWLKRLS